MAFLRLACWDFSSWQRTMMPVGLWTRRTLELVLLTDWPPGPLERMKDISRPPA